eukprot:CAMPEP_0198666702 /NCGR_PEP_ID=MMETSP1467-20131203/65732_1 /TAXON_ID=1462469 /ORGANISM="unid. sp., Strain CCMP2135" /LENGTH=315 /DNA_ID=CAMNT_0044403359 /DNA_START=11 /DNA_END=954 /DNA_ORIENTATION=-
MGGGVAALVGRYLSREEDSKFVQVQTLCGMASGLAAFFGQPVAGAFFALEVVHRHGLEHFEALLPAVAAGTACNVVFRLLCRLDSSFDEAAVWPFPTHDETTHIPAFEACVCYGLFFGLLAGALGGFWCYCLDSARTLLSKFTFLPLRSCLGGLLIGLLTCLAPASAFWGELEIRALLRGGPSPKLPHAPAAVSSLKLLGPTLADLDEPLSLVWVSFCKLLATFATVLAGYRGGYIFPLQHAGVAFGLGVGKLLDVDPTAAALLSATAVCVPATRCVFSVPFVVCALSGRFDLLAAALVASSASLLLTANVAVIS